MRTDIHNAVKRMPSKFGAKREIKALPDHLWEGETVHEIVSGAYADNVGILVATDRRLIFIFQGILRSTVEDFAYDKISSIELKNGMMLSSITVYASNQKAEIKNLSKEEAKRLSDFARANISMPATSSSESTADQLLKLKKLHESGVLTDEEYNTKSAPLIAQL